MKSGSDEALAPLPEIRSLARRAIVTERIARGDHHPLARAREAGVWAALERAVHGDPASVLRALEMSGERGRGGAGFPTGAKWRHAAATTSAEKYAVANGDEGDPGSFIDRLLLESDPHAVLEGLALCAFAIGARHGIVYVRSEYPRAAERVESAIAEARAAGLLGASVAGSDFALDVHVVRGEGSYVCGEETALIGALEGRRGEVRVRPPYPTSQGLFGKPTVVNNAETLVNAPWIVRNGPDAFRALGTRASRGTKAISLNAGFARPGIVEVEFGVSLRELVEGAAGGARDGGALAAVALGGPMGSVLLPDEWDVPVCYEALGAREIELGHGGIVALPVGTDFRALARDWLAFMADESCGKCVPCRVGSNRAKGLADARTREADTALLPLLDVIADASLCAFGQSIPAPVRTILTRLDASWSGGRRAR
ncbi:MAG: NADH-ubiquinone oxidoreductase-F iron-sulfur binding region domain-containing protein [Myxococcota bacterium]